MVFSIAIIVFVGIVAYFHFVQGFFSATLSAIAAVIAAVLAVGYDESLVHLLLRGTGADNINALCLVMIFVVAYVALRLIFDKLVPGNVRIPATVNYLGAALMGLVAGVFCMGTFAIAVQMLPFDGQISFLGGGRWNMLAGRKVGVAVVGNGQALDSTIRDQMEADTFDPAKEQRGLLLPVDDIVLDTAAYVSGGSLATDRTLTSIHPDWLGELFAQRVGIQTGTRHVALVLPKSDPITLGGVYRTNELPVFDPYDKAFLDKQKGTIPLGYQIRPAGYTDPYKSRNVKAPAGKVLLVVRINLTPAVTDDDDHIFRTDAGSLRLVIPPADGNGPSTDHYPIGTLEDGKTMVACRADDFLFVNLSNGDGAIDAVYEVDGSVLAGKGKSAVVVPGAFVNVNRLKYLDLSDQTVHDTLPEDDKAQLIRSDVVKHQLHPPDEK